MSIVEVFPRLAQKNSNSDRLDHGSLRRLLTSRRAPQGVDLIDKDDDTSFTLCPDDVRFELIQRWFEHVLPGSMVSAHLNWPWSMGVALIEMTLGSFPAFQANIGGAACNM